MTIDLDSLSTRSPSSLPIIASTPLTGWASHSSVTLHFDPENGAGYRITPEMESFDCIEMTVLRGVDLLIAVGGPLAVHPYGWEDGHTYHVGLPIRVPVGDDPKEFCKRQDTAAVVDGYEGAELVPFLCSTRQHIGEVQDLLLAGCIPYEWQSPNGAANLAECVAGSTAALLISAGVRKIEKVHAERGIVGRKAGRILGAYCFSSSDHWRHPHALRIKEQGITPMNWTAKLSRSMADRGWTQWQASVQMPGTSGKRDRYAVHAWLSPSGDVVLPMLKLGGKPSVYGTPGDPPPSKPTTPPPLAAPQENIMTVEGMITKYLGDAWAWQRARHEFEDMADGGSCGEIRGQYYPGWTNADFKAVLVALDGE